MASKSRVKKSLPAVQGFVSFADVAGPVARTNTDANTSQSFPKSSVLQPVYTGGDSELAAACRQVFKKDPITRAKALVSVRAVLDARGALVCGDFIAHFAYLYSRLLLDNQRITVEHLNSVLLQLVQLDRAALKPFMKDLVGYWWIAMHDPYVRPAEVAAAAFDSAFPVEKREAAVRKLLPSMLLAIQSTLRLDKTTIDASEENADDCIERAHTMSLAALARLLDSPSSELSAALSQQEESSAFLGTASFWSLWLHNPSASIRRRVYALLCSVCKLRKHISVDGLNEQTLKAVSKALTDTHALNTVPLLDMFIAFARECPALLTGYSIEKHLAPALRRLVNTQPDIVFEFLLPVAASLPESVISVSGTNVKAYCSLLEYIVTGMNESKIPSALLISGSVCVIENCCLVLVRRPPVAADIDAVSTLLGLMLDAYALLLEAMTATDTVIGPSINTHVAKVLAKLNLTSANSPAALDWTAMFWEPLAALTLAKVSVASEHSFQVLRKSTQIIALAADASLSVPDYTGGMLLVLRRVLYAALASLKRRDSFLDSLMWASALASLSSSVSAACTVAGVPLSDVVDALSLSWVEDYSLDSAEARSVDSHLLALLSSVNALGALMSSADHARLTSSLIDALLLSSSLLLILPLLQSPLFDSATLSPTQTCAFEDLFDQLLSGTHGDSKALVSRILLLAIMLTHHSFENKQAYAQRVMLQWQQSKSSVCLWTLLTVYCHSMGGAEVSAEMEVSAPMLIKAAFFGRNRDASRISSASTSTGLAVLTSWNDVKSCLFPKLSRGVAMEIASSLAEELSGLLFSGVIRTEAVDDEGAMQPKKLARHCCGLLSLADSQLLGNSTVSVAMSPSDVSVLSSPLNRRSDRLSAKSEMASTLETKIDLVKRIGLSDVAKWTPTSLEFIVQTLMHICELWEGDSGFLWIGFLATPHTFLATFVSLQNQMFSEALQAFMQAFTKLDAKQSIDLVIGSLDLLVAPSQSFSSLPLSQFMLTKRLLAAIFQLKLSDIPLSSKRVIDSPVPSDVVLKGSKVWYLRPVSSESAGRGGVVAFEAEVVHVDRQNVDSPFYTVVYRSAGVEIEVQTESHRLLLSAPEADLSAIAAATEDAPSVSSSVAEWTTQQLEVLSTAKVQSEKAAAVEVVCAALSVLGEMADSSSSFAATFATKVCPCAQKAILSMLAVDLLTSYETIEYAFAFTKSLIGSKFGIGSGLWLPQVIERLQRMIGIVNSTSRLVLSTSEREKLVLCVVSGATILLRSIQSRTLVDLLQSIVPALLQSTQTDAAKILELQLKIVEVFSHIWENKASVSRGSTKDGLRGNAAQAAEARAAKEIPQELGGLNIALQLLISPVLSLESKLSVAAALHHCFRGKERSDAQSLLAASDLRPLEATYLSLVDDSTAPGLIRLCAAKALDIFYLTSTLTFEPVQENPVDEEDVDEAEEQARDRAVFVEVVGTQLEGLLRARKAARPRPSEYVNREHDLLRLVLEWLLCLQRIDAAAMRNYRVRFQCASYLRKSDLLGLVLRSLTRALPDQTKIADVSHLFQKIDGVDEAFFANSKVPRFSMLVVYCVFRTVYTLPAIVRSWWSDSSTREQKSVLRALIENSFSTAIAAREVAFVRLAALEGKWKNDEMTVRGSAVSGEVIATYIKDGVNIELKIKLPSAYPLLNVEVECSSRVGVSEGRWKRWVLQIVQLLSMQDGSIVDAILILKKNIDKEFDGVEPCPICYSILHPKSMSLPSLACPTCANKFHNQCLFTWFKSSGKSKCVICQQPFFL